MEGQQPSHADLWQRIEKIDDDVRRTFEEFRKELLATALKTAGIVFPFALGIVIWFWQAISTQAEVNGRLQERLDSNGQGYADARAAQQRIEERLNEINRYIREDGKEQRQAMQLQAEALQRHIDAANGNHR